MSAMEPLEPNAAPMPAADVQAPQKGRVEYEAYPVRKPEVDLEDFKVEVRASTLSRCRRGLEKAAKNRFPWHELALAVGGLAGGASLGAIPSSIAAGSLAHTFFFTIMPALSVGSLVAFIFLRRSEFKRPSEAINEALEDLPNPDKTR